MKYVRHKDVETYRHRIVTDIQFKQNERAGCIRSTGNKRGALIKYRTNSLLASRKIRNKCKTQTKSKQCQESLYRRRKASTVLGSELHIRTVKLEELTITMKRPFLSIYAKFTISILFSVTVVIHAPLGGGRFLEGR